MRPLVAHCHTALASHYARQGHRQRSQEHAATAMTMYREMDMTGRLEKAQAELAHPA